MMLQSTSELLPAAPKAWLSGKVFGFRTRSYEWRNESDKNGKISYSFDDSIYLVYHIYFNVKT